MIGEADIVGPKDEICLNDVNDRFIHAVNEGIEEMRSVNGQPVAEAMSEIRNELKP